MYHKSLHAFHAVAKTGSFTGAAKALMVGQPTISTHVKALEDGFGVELFYRRGRSVELTPIGKALVTITQGIYGHEEEAFKFLESARKLEVGRLSLCAIGPFDVIEILETFRGRHPNVGLSVSLAVENSVLNSLDEFEADIGIIGRELDEPRYFTKLYNRHRVLVIVNAAHPLAKRKTIKVKDLEGLDMILRPPVSTTRQAFESAIAEAGVEINPVMEINSREAVREAIIRGFGCGVVTESEYYPDERLRALRVSDADMHTMAIVICLKEREKRPLIRAFLDVVDDLVAARPSHQRPRRHRTSR